MANLKFYTDSALLTELSSAVIIEQNVDGSTGDVDGVVYLGSVVAGKSYQADSDPGVDSLILTIADADPSAITPLPADLKIATTNAGLAAAVAGAPLDLGLTIQGGEANRVEVHYRMATPAAPVADYSDLSFALTAVREI